MASHDWPGNVRELVNVASVAATLADEPGAIDDVLTLARDEAVGDDAARDAATGEHGLQRREADGHRRVRARLLHGPGAGAARAT